MEAYFVGQDGKGSLQKTPLPIRRPGEALIKISRAGICNTDLEILKGYMNFKGILGHEFVGKVCEVDTGANISVGQRVVGEINLPCNDCELCKQGGVIKRNHCLKRSVLGILSKDGTYASHVTLPVANLFPVPGNVSDEQAAFAEPLAAAFRIIEQDLIKETDRVALIGDGKLGLLIAMVVNSIKKQEFIVFGKHEDKLMMLPSEIDTSISNETTKIKYKDYFDVVIDACGSPNGLAQAIDIVKPLGTIVLKTTCASNPVFNESLVVIKEIKIIGSRCGNFLMALEALANGTINVDKLLSKVYPLEDVDKALKHAATKGALKIQLDMSTC